MQALKRLLLPVLAVVVLVAATPSVSRADDGWGGVDCSTSPGNPRCTVEVGYTGGGSSHGGGGGSISCTIGGQAVECYNSFGWLGSDGCYYGKDSGGFLPANEWIRTCINPTTDEVLSVSTVILDAPPVALGVLTQRAVDSLEIPRPVIASNPKFTVKQVVWVPVWWWVQPGWWQTQTASASAGGLTITARAVPKKITWNAGDGTSTKVCEGPGTPWSPSAGMDTESPDCGHTYKDPSDEGGYTVRAVATWDISWSGGGFSGTEPAITTATTANVTVTQRRSVVSG
ncbi:hypothetical protein [Actinoplanes regularis]|uniref:PKD domain-containing protein n=1 Tax=Actinoplanes regularis TaxID=52697 RepID=A0A239EWX8_9ACTN|nr:hypothetical protein [Actinoplanes regularis]GIE89741.1 hypothetical protein Are01nite_62210 [Actinoplanes regularis]SNS49166.1 hypothetical protein SAMN06264365_116154 [Actinoplanes regularis]